jgi:adenylylsulfate kinase-like enzyme
MNWNDSHHKTDGRVIWITGLSGAGKSTIAGATVEHLNKLGEFPVLIDGDEIREAIADPHTGHDPNSRLANAYRISRLAKLFADQSHTVIVATMSLFHEIHKWNRTNITNYFEVWVEVDLPTLKARDARGLYSRAANQQAEHVAGIDISYERPVTPDLTLENTGLPESIYDIAEQLIENTHRELIYEN